MSTFSDNIDALLENCPEGPKLEFKEAKLNFDQTRLMKYCVAIANEGGGQLILGVTDKIPRKVVGTKAFTDTQDIRRRLATKLKFSVETEEIIRPDGRILVFHIPGRPRGTAYELDGAFFMRCGEDLVPMTPDKLREIHYEDKSDWLLEASLYVDTNQITELLNTRVLFDLIETPYPTEASAVIDKLELLSLISKNKDKWAISKMAALLFANRLSDFPAELNRKAIRIIFYKGNNKLETRLDRFVEKGYAVAFNDAIDFIYDSAPLNRIFEESVRKEIPMFPKQAIRELVANAIVHQDFSISGSGVTIEMYSNRLEISNPGKPEIPVDRFIDENISRNAKFADLMRRMRLCEEKGSGIDKVVQAAEYHMLPAPDFILSDLKTIAVLFSHQEFSEMSKQDRIRACYQHACLMYITRNRMTNQSLRNRFKLPENKTTLTTQIISAALDAGVIKLDVSDTTSRRYAKYLPNWA